MVSTQEEVQRSFGMCASASLRNWKPVTEVDTSSEEDLCDSGRGSFYGSFCSAEFECAMERIPSAFTLSNEGLPSPTQDYCAVEDFNFSCSSDESDETDCPTPRVDYPGLSFALWETARSRRFHELEQLLMEVSRQRSSYTSASSSLDAVEDKRKKRRVRFADQAVDEDVARARSSDADSMRDASSGCSPRPLAASVDYRNLRGVTPLHLCCFAGELRSVRLLLSLGADPNAADADGWTPAHAASAMGHSEVIVQLATSGAALRLRDLDGRRPRHVTRDQTTKDVIRWLSRITRTSARATLL